MRSLSNEESPEEKTELLWAPRAPYLLAYSQLKAIQTLPLIVGVLSRHRAIHNDCGILKTTKAISAILRPLATEGIYWFDMQSI